MSAGVAPGGGAPTQADADLEACAREAIHLPGSIQPHGCLLWVGPEGTVTHTSANVATLLGWDAHDVLGARLADVLGPAAALVAAAPDGVAPDPVLVEVAGRTEAFDVAVHRPAPGELVVELEPAGDDARSGAAWYQSTRQVFQRLQRARDVVALAAVVCEEVRALTGFDRVMVYRFDADYAGEVIAEALGDGLEPFLGLWYPASDIPPQARALYLRNHIRLIADASYTPVPLLPPRRADGSPLDLSDAGLRSVSPVHLEYLRNMGVAASMSVSLLERERLWGLIACHHESGPRRPPLRVRAAAEFVGEAASLVLGSLQRTAQDRRRSAAADAERALVEAMTAADDLGAGLAGAPALLELLGAGGAALRLGGALHLAGATPPPEVVDDLVHAALATSVDGVGWLDAVPDQPLATGVLAVGLAGAPGHHLAWFRPEVLRTVEWGGDPTAKVRGEEGRIGPRVSFARWSETVRGRAWPWSDGDVEAAAALGRLVGDVLLRRARQQEALAGALHRAVLLEELPDPPGLELAARYDASGEGLVGGDWFDLLYRPDGTVVVSVGDVAGHGLAATAVTAQLRNALRAHLLTTATPGEALGRLNHLARQLLPTELATVVVADVVPGGTEVRIASAGHLPALAAGPGGARLLVPPRAPGVGMVADPTYETASFTLAPGEALFLYSDGLVERRGETIDDGLDRLLAVAADLPADLDEACGELLRRVRGVGADDDVTLLAVRPRP